MISSLSYCDFISSRKYFRERSLEADCIHRDESVNTDTDEQEILNYLNFGERKIVLLLQEVLNSCLNSQPVYLRHDENRITGL
jgi:hypothetical protein